MRIVDHDSASADFLTGKFPTRARNMWVDIHRGSGSFKGRSREFKTRDQAIFDFPIEQREIIRRVLWVLESPDKGFEERFISSGRKKRRSCGSERDGWRICVTLVCFK